MKNDSLNHNILSWSNSSTRAFCETPFNISIINNLITSITSYVRRKGRRAWRNIQVCAFFTVALEGVKWLNSWNKRLCTQRTECWMGFTPGPYTTRRRNTPVPGRNLIRHPNRSLFCTDRDILAAVTKGSISTAPQFHDQAQATVKLLTVSGYPSRSKGSAALALSENCDLLPGTFSSPVVFTSRTTTG